MLWSSAGTSVVESELPELIIVTSSVVSRSEYHWPDYWASSRHRIEDEPLWGLRPRQPAPVSQIRMVKAYSFGRDLLARQLLGVSRISEGSPLPGGVSHLLHPEDLLEPWKAAPGQSLVEEIASILSELQSLEVRVPRAEEVQQYLLRFPDAIEVVKSAVTAALRHLPRAQLSLEVYHDPEISDEYLALYARFRQYDGSVMEAIGKAESEYADLLVDKKGWLVLTTDFREPE